MDTTDFYRNHVRYAWLAREDAKRCHRKAIAEPSRRAHWTDLGGVSDRAYWRHEAEASQEFHHGPAMERLMAYARSGRRVPAPVPEGMVEEVGALRACYQVRLTGHRHARRWVWVWLVTRESRGETTVMQLVEHEDLWTLRGIVAHYTRWDCRAYRND